MKRSLQALVTLLFASLPPSTAAQTSRPTPLTYSKVPVVNKDFGFRFTIQDRSGIEVAVLDNSTTSIIKAMSSRGLVIVLGWTQIANLITVFKAPGKAECLELLCYDAHLSPDAEYVSFRRFFPPTTSSQLVRDTVAVLSMSAVRENRVPCLTRIGSAPPTDLGVNIYPQHPHSGYRILGDFIWEGNSRSFFFLDTRPPTGYLLVRADLTGTQWSTKTSSLEVVPGLPMLINRFSTDGAGHLVVEAQREGAPPTKYQTIYDPQSLSPLPSAELPSNTSVDVIPVDIPWAVASRALIYPSSVKPVPIAGATNQVIPARITISPDGSVIAVTVVSDKPEIKRAIINELLSWRFKPSIVNGKRAAVNTTVPVPLAPG